MKTSFKKKNELLIKKKPSFIDGNQGQFVKLNTNSITIRMVPTITMWDLFAAGQLYIKILRKNWFYLIFVGINFRAF